MLQVLICSKENFVLSKNSLVRKAEPLEDVKNKCEESKKTNIVWYNDIMSHKNNDVTELQSKLQHLSRSKYQVLWSMFKEYEHLFNKPIKDKLS